jgi:selenocysteine lyase/cysteine desulfurase
MSHSFMDPNDPTPWKTQFETPPEDVVYFNNAGSSQIPLSVAEIGTRRLQWKQHPWGSDSGEGSDSEVRNLYSSLIGAESPNCIAFAPSTGFGMSLAAQNILHSGALKQPCRILITESEEDSNVFPWQNICAHPDSQACLEVVPRPDLGRDPAASWSGSLLSQLAAAAAAGPPVAILAVSCVHWCEGSLLGVETIAAHLRSLPADKRPYFIIDGTQSIGALPFDVMALGADFVACSVHKWLLSPYGTSILYLHPRHHQTWQPLDQHERYRLGSCEAE